MDKNEKLEEDPDRRLRIPTPHPRMYRPARREDISRLVSSETNLDSVETHSIEGTDVFSHPKEESFYI